MRECQACELRGLTREVGVNWGLFTRLQCSNAVQLEQTMNGKLFLLVSFF